MIWCYDYAEPLPNGYAEYRVVDSISNSYNYLYAEEIVSNDNVSYGFMSPTLWQSFPYTCVMIGNNYADACTLFSNSLYLPDYVLPYVEYIDNLYYLYTVDADFPTWAVYYYDTLTIPNSPRFIRVDVLYNYIPRPSLDGEGGVFNFLYNIGLQVSDATHAIVNILNYKIFGLFSFFDVITVGFVSYMAYAIAKWLAGIIP